MLVAQLAQALQIAHGRHQHAGGAGHRLDHHRRNGVAMQRDQVLQRVGQLGPVLRQAAGEGVAGQVMRVRQVVHIGQHGAELLAVATDAAHGHAAEADAVVAALPPHQPHALALAARLLVGEGDLQRGVRALAAGIGEEDAVQPLGRDLGDARRRLEGDGVAELEGRREIHHRRLLLDGLGDLAPAMAGIAAPQPGGAVDHLLPVRGEIGHALGPGQQAGVGLEVAVVRVGHPERVQIVGTRHGDLVHGHPARGCGEGKAG